MAISPLEILQVKYLGLLLEKKRVVFKKTFGGAGFLPHLGGFSEGSTSDIPYWVAKILREDNYLEVEESEPFTLEFFRTLMREKMQPTAQLSSIKKDVYVKLKDFLWGRGAPSSANVAYERERRMSDAFDFLMIRLRKILQLASSSIEERALVEKLLPEELALFALIKLELERFRNFVMVGESWSSTAEQS